MDTRFGACIAGCVLLSACSSGRFSSMAAVDHSESTERAGTSQSELKVSVPEPYVIGQTFTIRSQIMGEVRHINTFVPTMYGEKIDDPMPVLYMPDGGANEDFLHIAGLVQVLVSDGSMRPFMVVGIQNTSRRRDMTGPTTNDDDRKIAPVVGGSTVFRRFIKDELMPTVRARYRTTDEAAVMGESLAGLFVVETYFVEPDLFTSYIAIDPSLWWNGAELVRSAEASLKSTSADNRLLFLASSNEPTIAAQTAQLADIFGRSAKAGPSFHYAPLPNESHATIYHPAAMRALRAMFAPAAPVNEDDGSP